MVTIHYHRREMWMGTFILITPSAHLASSILGVTIIPSEQVGTWLCWMQLAAELRSVPTRYRHNPAQLIRGCQHGSLYLSVSFGLTERETKKFMSLSCRYEGVCMGGSTRESTHSSAVSSTPVGPPPTTTQFRAFFTCDSGAPDFLWKCINFQSIKFYE